ncbi:MAG: PAS domain S-box, partial [Gammaproteobacteria bacterium]|nr:PAS domain S-box [Gammaproteobacteria bacterium]
MNVTRYKPKVKRAPRKSALRAARKRTQIELREKNFADEALNSLPGLYYLIDDQGRFLRWNKNFETVSGYSSEEISRLSPTDFFDGPEKEIIAERIRQVFQTGAASVEADFVAKDRSRTPYLFTGKRVQIDRKPCLSGMGIDITERKRIERELRESELTYRSLFENMLNGFAYCRMLYENGQPQDFIYLAVNDAFETQTGLKNVVGRRVTEVIPGIREADSRLFELYGRVAMTGQPERFEVFVESLQQWFSISAYCPKPEHFVAVFDIITERRRAAATLRESEEKLSAIFEGALDGILVA